MTKQRDPATDLIQLTRQQVQKAMAQLIEDLQEQYPDAQECENIAEALGGLFERSLIRDNLLPRVEGHTDISWLRANGIRFAVKSSVAQFVEQHVVRIQVAQPDDRKLWRAWLAS